MKRIAVVGASGLLGSTLVPTLIERRYDVIPISRTAGAKTADFTDRPHAWHALDAVRPDVIVNLAALTDVDACESSPERAFALNARMVGNIADWVTAQGGAVHLIQVSTDQLYDGSGPHVEDAISPLNYYGYSKYAGELLAARAGATVLRTNLFGRSRRAGRASLSDWLVGVLRQRQPARVFRDVLFTPLRMETLSEMIALAIERRAAGTFNLGSTDGMSKADFAFALARALGLASDLFTPADSADAPLRARRPKDMRMNCTRFEGTFGVKLPSLDSEINRARGDYAS
jgi:dTDP-4-dehydrorhamnose reductase